jgi:hypothetical protein
MNGGEATLTFFATASVIALLGWAAWALLTFEIGTRLLPTADTRADPGELLRTLGFAAAPGLIQGLGAFPEAQRPIFVIAVLWTVAASVVAVRQALDYTSTARALAVCGPITPGPPTPIHCCRARVSPSPIRRSSSRRA